MQIVCPQCSARNRVPEDKLQDNPLCGGCKTPLLPTRPVDLDDARLPAYLQGTSMPVVVDFWASWCGPCKMMAPFFKEAAQAMPGIRFIKVDSDANPQSSAHYRIRSIPTLILFRDGREIARQSGVMNTAQLQQWLQSHL